MSVPQPQRDPSDVRMRGFTSRTTVADAIAWIDQLVGPLPGELLGLEALAGRVLAETVRSSLNIPSFSRAMMDGYAVQASDTLGASTYNPLRLTVIGSLFPGQVCQQQVDSGTCLRIMTGAALPKGADAVLPAEYVQAEQAGGPSPSTVMAMGQVSPGKHVGSPGEDIRDNEVVAQAGRRLRPQDLGVLASIGVAQTNVVRQPRVRIVVTGDELLPLGAKPSGVKIVDANSVVLQACIRRDGGESIQHGLTPDDPQDILAAMSDDQADVVLVSGGSSVGQEDHAPMLLAKYGELAIHGVAVRPSSPAGMGRLNGRLVFLLPGNPVSCLCAYDLFAGRAIRQLSGLPAGLPYQQVRRRLRRKIVSQIGRVDYARVKLVNDLVEPLAISGASVLSSTTRADGFVLVPSDSEGFPEGAEVDVWLYDSFAANPPMAPKW